MISSPKLAKFELILINTAYILESIPVSFQTLKKGKTFLKIEKVIKVGETFEWDWENTLWKAAVLASFEGMSL